MKEAGFIQNETETWLRRSICGLATCTASSPVNASAEAPCPATLTGPTTAGPSMDARAVVVSVSLLSSKL